MLTSNLAALIESGVSMIIGTRDASMRPECIRALGARVAADRSRLTVFVPLATAGRAVANLCDNGRIAVTFSRIADHHTVQLKGCVEAIAPADPDDRHTVDRYRRAVASELEIAGLPQHVVFRVHHWPCWAITLRPDEVFDQSPGPGAGQMVSGAEQRLLGLPRCSGSPSLPKTTVMTLEQLDSACFQGLVPSLMATCDLHGEPNVTYLSQVFAVDSRHVALSCQFFNKTKRNLLENPFATVQLNDPLSFQAWQLRLRYLREETSGPLFDAMAARIEVIASHTGMSGVFRLRSADIHEVLAVERLDDFLLADPVGEVEPPPKPAAGMRLGELQGLQTISARIAGACDLEQLLSEALRALDELLGLEHTMVLVLDDDGSRLVALGSHGYGESGLGPAGSGAEVEVGAGVIGTAAATRRLVRVAGIGSGLSYGRAVRDRQQALTPDHQLPPQIALPGLPDAQAQLALPMLVGSELVGVLAAESRDPLAFDEWDEAFLQIVANQIGVRIRSFDDAEDDHDATRTPAHAGAAPAASAQARRRFVFYPHDDAVFVDGEYLIRNVPGRILWKILTGYVTDGRRELSNRELRLDRSLGLPTYRDNLESRLILLRKRLQDRCPDVRLVPVRRGRFALETSAVIELEERRE